MAQACLVRTGTQGERPRAAGIGLWKPARSPRTGTSGSGASAHAPSSRTACGPASRPRRRTGTCWSSTTLGVRVGYPPEGDDSLGKAWVELTPDGPMRTVAVNRDVTEYWAGGCWPTPGSGRQHRGAQPEPHRVVPRRRRPVREGERRTGPVRELAPKRCAGAPSGRPAHPGELAELRGPQRHPGGLLVCEGAQWTSGRSARGLG